MTLKSAITTYQKTTRSGNAYSYYQREARTNGHITLADVNIKAFKVGGAWHVSPEDFSLAMQSYELRQEQRRKASEDLQKGIIIGENGKIVEIQDGYYIKHGQFHFVVSAYQAARRKDDGTWYCTNCKSVADTEHSKTECHNCQEGWGCNRDCTLSKVLCKKCGRFLNV